MNCPVCAASAPRLGYKAEYVAYKCASSSCRHLFLWPPPSAPLAIYTEKYFTGGENGFGYVNYDLDKAPMEPSFQRYLELIEKLTKGPGHLCDIGAATGVFLEIARAGGWEVSGFEPSEYAASKAREKGLDVATGVLPKGAGPYDVITALDVIEHVSEPREFVRNLRLCLRDSGIFAVNTPDSGSTIAKMMGLDWHAILPPEHLHLFNARSIRMLLEQEGFELLSCHSIGKRFTLQYIAQTLARWRRMKFFKRLADSLQDTALGQIDLALNLSDNLFVIARKRQRK